MILYHSYRNSYRIVLGMDAKTFRKAHGIEHGKSIRPYLTEAQYKAIRELQKMIENAFLKELMIKYAHKKKSTPLKGVYIMNNDMIIIPYEVIIIP